MDQEFSPISGIMQPTLGMYGRVPWPPMGRKRTPKAPAALDPLVELLGRNVETRMQERYATIESDSERVKALAKASGVGRSTIWRIIKGETATSVDKLAKLARALDVSPEHLLRDRRRKSTSPTVSARPRDSVGRSKNGLSLPPQ